MRPTYATEIALLRGEIEAKLISQCHSGTQTFICNLTLILFSYNNVFLKGNGDAFVFNIVPFGRYQPPTATPPPPPTRKEEHDQRTYI